MVICRDFAYSLDCPLLNHCPNEHFDIVSFVREEIEFAINGNQWPLSCFGPISNKPSCPNYIEDQSFEEIRLMYYGSTKFSQSCRKFSRAIIESEEKANSLMAMINNDAVDILCELYDFDDEAYEEPSHNFHSNPFNKKNIPNSNKPVFGAPISGFPVPGGSKKELEMVPFKELQDSFSKPSDIGFTQPNVRTAAICPFQHTQQANASEPAAFTSAIPSHDSFERKESYDCKELLKGVALKMDSICKMFEENKAATKLLQDRTLINSAKLLSISQKNNEQPKIIEPPKKNASILIKPKRKQSCGKTKKFIKANIDPIKLSIQINNIIRGSYGSIIIECRNEESVKKLERHVELECGSYFETQILHLSKPRIQISGIGYEIAEDKLIGIIKSQNKLKHEIKLIKTFEEINDSSKYNAIAEIDEKLYEKLQEDKDPYFNVGWAKCNVYDNVDVKRCSNCWGFNHTENNCPDKAHIPKRRISFVE